MKKLLLFFLFLLLQSTFINTMDRAQSDGGQKKKKTHHKVPKLAISDLVIPMGHSPKTHKGEGSGGGSTSKSDGKIIPQSIDDLHKIIQTRSLQNLQPKKRPDVIINDDDHTSKSVDSFQSYLASLKPQESEIIVDNLMQEIYVSPKLFIECRFKYHGEPDKNPRPYEEEEWEKIMNSRPEKYDRLVKELFLIMVNELYLQSRNNNQASPQISGEFLKPTEFVEAHFGVVRGHADKLGIKLEKSEHWIFISKICHFINVCFGIGATAWGIYNQVNVPTANCMNVTSV